MTLSDLLNRISAALRSGDQSDLIRLSETVHGMLIEENERDAWNNLIHAAIEAI